MLVVLDSSFAVLVQLVADEEDFHSLHIRLGEHLAQGVDQLRKECLRREHSTSQLVCVISEDDIFRKPEVAPLGGFDPLCDLKESELAHIADSPIGNWRRLGGELVHQFLQGGLNFRRDIDGLRLSAPVGKIGILELRRQTFRIVRRTGRESQEASVALFFRECQELFIQLL